MLDGHSKNSWGHCEFRISEARLLFRGDGIKIPGSSPQAAQKQMDAGSFVQTEVLRAWLCGRGGDGSGSRVGRHTRVKDSTRLTDL